MKTRDGARLMHRPDGVVSWQFPSFGAPCKAGNVIHFTISTLLEKYFLSKNKTT
jgi:hypothetical protein